MAGRPWGDVPQHNRVAGGNPPQRRDQLLQPTSRAGVGPAPQSNVFLGRLAVIFGTGANTGLFVYNGAPALGNPPILAVTTASSDPYGNPVTPSAITDSGMPLLVYSGPAALGNLISSTANATGHDIFGNAFFGPGATFYGNVGGTFYAMNLNGNEIEFLTAPGAGGPYTSGGANMNWIAGGGGGLELTAPNNVNLQVPSTHPSTAFFLFSTQAVLSPNGAGPATAAMLEVQGATAQIVAELIADAAATNALGIRVSGDTNNRINWSAAGQIGWGSGAATPDTFLSRISADLLGVTSADFTVHTAGNGLRVAEGSNAKQGTATLAAGTVVVANTSVTATSRILLTAQDNNSAGALRVSARTAGTSFTITSSNGADSGVVAYEIFQPG